MTIIIDEIVPTKWRLRLRDADGKTREVVYRAGTPLQLDAASAADEPGEGTSKAQSPKERREKPRAEAVEKPEKPRASNKAKSEAAAPAAKAERKEDAGEKSTSTPKPQVRRRKHEAGPGPGGLVWEEAEDDGVTGLRASFGKGAFKVLHAGGETYGLFYEWNSGKYQTLTCGSLEALKQVAAQWTEDGKLRAPRSNLGAEAAKMACATKEEPPAAPPAAKPPPPAPPVDPEKDKLLMQGFEASVEKLMAARKGTP